MRGTEIIILIEGYLKIISENRCRASGTIVLVRDNGKNILVDTGNPKDKDKIVQALKKQGLAPDDIDFVIITHFHSDHVGCNYLFSKARFVTPPVAFWNDIFENPVNCGECLSTSCGENKKTGFVSLRNSRGKYFRQCLIRLALMRQE